MKIATIARAAGFTGAAAIVGALLPGAANAGTANSNVTVTATVSQDCKMSTTTNVGFGSYDPVTVSAVTNATGALSVTCTKAASGVTLTLSAGNNPTHATTPQTRAMIGSAHSNYISYDVFEDSGYTTRFPTTAVSETVTGGITTPTTISLYGQIPAAAQDVSIDSYSDTLVATLNF